MRTTGWIFLLWVLSSACNRVIDSQPMPSIAPAETIPASAIQTVVGQFPQAGNIIFTPLEKNRVWQVSFEEKAVRYQAVTNQQLLLVAYQLANAALPDSLTAQLANTVVEGGTFSNLRVQNYAWFRSATNNGQIILADYEWRGNRYMFRWNITTLNGQITYLTEMLPNTQLEYRTVTLADLPPLIQQSLVDQQVDFDNAEVQIDEQAKKRYSLTVRQTNSVYTLTYDNAGQLVSAVNLNAAQRFTSVSQLPSAIQSYLSNTAELAGFTPSGQFSLLAKTQYSYHNLETYSVNLQKGRQTWFLTFDGRGQLLSRSYLNMV